MLLCDVCPAPSQLGGGGGLDYLLGWHVMQVILNVSGQAKGAKDLFFVC